MEKDDSTNRSGGGAGLMHLKFIQHQRLTAIRKANYKKVDTLFIKIGVFMNEKIYPAVLRDYLGTGPTNNTVYYDLKAL